MTSASSPGGGEPGSVRLSTGERVDLSLHTDVTMAGATFSASRERTADLLPDGLSPVPTGSGRGAVAVLCVEYERIGSGEIEPYDEFGVVVPAVRERGARGEKGSILDRPLVSTLGTLLVGGVGGYVWSLPVTTEPARALGEGIWGYPEAVADVTVERDGRDWRTAVTVNGDHLVTLDVRAPSGVRWSQSAHSYAVEDGTPSRQPLKLNGELGAWPLGRHAAYELGDHPRVDRLRRLDLGSRPLGRFGANGEFVVHAGEPVEVGRTGVGTITGPE